MKDIEKNIRQKLDNYPSPLDTDRLWTGIDAGLQRRRRRRRWFWLPVLVAGLASVSALGWWLWPQGGVSTNGAPNHSNQIQQEMANGTAGQKTASALDWGLANNKAGHPSASIENPNEGKLTVPVTTSIETQKKLSGAKSPPARNAQPQHLLTGNIHPDHFDENRETDLPSNVQPGQTTGMETEQAAQASYTDLARLPLLQSFVFFETMPENWPKGGPRVCDDFFKKKNLHSGRRAFSAYLGMNAGLQYPWKKLEAGSDDISNVIRLRKESETVLEAWSVGVFAGLQHRSGWALEVGTEYQRINERFRIENRTTDTIGSVKIITTVVHAPGDTSFSATTEPVVRHTHIVHTTYNNYRFVHLPVGLAYTFRRAGHWQPYVRAGAMVNLHFGYKAEIFINADPQSQLFLSEKTAGPSPFRSRIGLTPYAAVGARFRANQSLSFFGEIHYQHHTTPVSATGSFGTQQYRLPGLNVGARVDLGL